MRHPFYCCGPLLLSVLVSGCEAQPAVSQTAPARTARPAPAPAAEPRLVREFFVDDDRLSYGGYEIVRREREVKVEYPSELRTEVSYAVLKKKGRVVAKFEGVVSGFGNATEFGLFDFLGDGAKQLVVSQTVPRGGRHWVVSLSPSLRVIYDSAEYGLGREEMAVLDVDGDGVHEISQELTTFVFFDGLTTGASHIIDILLKYDARERKYLPASHVFPDYTLAASKDGTEELSRGDDRALASGVLRRMLPCIYAGRREEAWAFYEREYAAPNKEELRAKILAALKGDPVYRYIYRRGRRAGAQREEVSSGER